MVNGMMENRDFFIKETKKLDNIDNIDDIWIVRAQTVIDQYGKGLESVRDDIDKKALKSGTMIESLDENIFGSSTYRITIPYKADVTSTINCLECHKTKEGETLGAISMVMSIDDLKKSSLELIGIIAFIMFILIFSTIIFIKRLVNPYFNIFTSIKGVMQKANGGDFSWRIETAHSSEAKEVAHWINEHMNRLETSLENIESQIDVFLTAHKEEVIIDPVEDVENTVIRLADIYKFRKTIERDEHIEEVYKRFAVILEEKFKIDNFNFLEADTTNKHIEVVYIVNPEKPNKRLYLRHLTP